MINKQTNIITCDKCCMPIQIGKHITMENGGKKLDFCRRICEVLYCTKHDIPIGVGTF